MLLLAGGKTKEPAKRDSRSKVNSASQSEALILFKPNRHRQRERKEGSIKALLGNIREAKAWRQKAGGSSQSGASNMSPTKEQRLGASRREARRQIPKAGTDNCLSPKRLKIDKNRHRKWTLLWLSFV